MLFFTLQLSWRRVVVRKWLNRAKNSSDYSADSESGSDFDSEEEFCDWPRESRFKSDKPDELQVDANGELANNEVLIPIILSLCLYKDLYCHMECWWKSSPDDLDIDVSKWENIIREALNRVPPVTKFKSYSDPPSPSRFKPSEYAPDIEDEIVLESDSDVGEEIYPLNEEPNVFCETKDGLIVEGRTDDKPEERELDRQFSSPKRLDRLNCLRTDDCEDNVEDQNAQYINKLTKTLSVTERIGLSWPEQPLHLLPQHDLEKPNSFKSVKSFKASKSFRTYSSFKSNMMSENRMKSDIGSLVELDLESVINRKRRPSYVRIVSKQMVGIFITVWVRRSLRRHIQNLNVSTVGVGVMGFIGNKHVCASDTLLFCLYSFNIRRKDADAVKRNADVHEIHRRTRFNSLSAIGLPRRIYDHEAKLVHITSVLNEAGVKGTELIKEFKKGRAFDGWSEGTLSFAPTYKYELNSESYVGEEPKAGRRTPAWCDRILSFGTGMRLLSYRRSEVKLSDHRPVTASYMVEVEVFSPRKLQRALTFTDAEIEEQDIVTDMGLSRCIILGALKHFVSYVEEATNGSIHELLELIRSAFTHPFFGFFVAKAFSGSIL
ncbi:hypothetical protein DH2020_035592 [Rehmannia glutinosa]|uniref:Inositol polyphosphate-related phosphatase domain-containing protein n=1 Tax=Rehmannia glutinosa TaxID=99300 RepID=A0ABR0V9A0_REHGL